MSVRILASLALAASFCLAPSSANAGLFGHNRGCCDTAPSCGCEIAMPSCGGCEVDVCCDPCARVGLLARIKARCAAKRACRTSCCDVAPSCGCEAAPSCGCGM